MSGASLHWLDRVAESLREHEDRATAIQSGPPRYEILGELSRGGMGIVYLAWDPQLGRNVALKVLRSEGSSPAAEAHERFQREAKLAAALHHPNIVQVFDTNTWNGQDYIAMQFIEGTTLDQAKLDRRQVLACIRDAARAMHYAHEQGIVHRDVKPGNLLVDKGGRVYVTDFGVARQAVVSATLTSPGTVVGTPTYMSPEQAQGLAVDARSDVYSLGATLYEMVAGRPPVLGKDAVEVLEAVRTKDPEPPGKVMPDLSKNVEAIILGAMERQREHRYPSAAAFADDIDRYLNGERPLRRPRGLTYRFRREFVRHPWRSGAAVVFCVLLLAAGIVLGYVLRAYLHWKRADRTTDLNQKLQELRIAGTVFPKALEEYTDLSTQLANKIVDDGKREMEAFERRRMIQIQEQAQIQKEATLEEKKRNEKISTCYQHARDYLSNRNVAAARKEIEGLQSLAPEKYEQLLPRLHALEFEVGLQELASCATKVDAAGFERAYNALQTPIYKSQPDFKSKLSPLAFQMAASLNVKNQPKDGLTWFTIAEDLGFGDPRLYELRGLALIGLGKWEEAQHDYDELVGRTRPGTIHPRAFAALPLRKGQRAAAQQDWAEAIKNFTLAVQLDSELAKAYHDRGIARFRSNGQAREALDQELRIAWEKDPKLVPDPLYRDVVLSFSKSQVERHWKSEDAKAREAAWRETIGWLTRFLQGKSSADPDLLLERSRMLRRLGDLSPALADAVESVRARPDGESRLHLGILRFLEAHPEKSEAKMREATAELDRAEPLAPTDPRVPYWRGICRRNLSTPDLDGALKDFLKASELNLRSAHLGLETAKVRLDLLVRDKDRKAWPAAVEDASRAVTGAEALSEEEYVAGFYEQRRMGRSQAIRLLTRDAYLLKGQALYEGQEYGKCVEECSAAIQLDPQYASAFLWRGYARCDDKVHHKAAQEDFRQAIRLSTHQAEKDNAGQWLSRCQKHARD